MDIKNIFGKVQEFKNSRFGDDDEDILDSAVSEEDYEDSRSSNKFSSGIFADEEETPVSSFASFNYSPTAALPDFGSSTEDFSAFSSGLFSLSIGINFVSPNSNKSSLSEKSYTPIVCIGIF